MHSVPTNKWKISSLIHTAQSWQQCLSMCYKKIYKNNDNSWVTWVCICHSRKKDSSRQNPDLSSSGGTNVIHLWSSRWCVLTMTVRKATLLFQCHSVEQQHIKAHLHHLPVELTGATQMPWGYWRKKKKKSCHNLPAPLRCSLWNISWSNWSFGAFWRPVVMKDWDIVCLHTVTAGIS